VGSMTSVIPFLARGPRENHHAWLDALRHAMPHYEIVAFDALSDSARLAARVAIVADPEPEQILQLPHLQWVQSLWAGVERMMAELPPSDIKIVRLVDPVLSQTMAEAVLAWSLYLHRDMPAYRGQQAQSLWHARDHIAAEDRNIAILGLGHLGRAAAKRLIENGFSVAGWSRTPMHVESVTTYSGNDGLNKMLSIADIVVVLLPLTPATTGLLNANSMAQMKRGASVINFGRGAIVSTAALIDKLDQGHLNHAVLDVFETEPLPTESALWQHPKITILPHISAPTNKKTASAIVAGNIKKFLDSGIIPEHVDWGLGY
jgi:glyoxylate/hydroxypyruvate reductase